jgi:hypothetical protein
LVALLAPAGADAADGEITNAQFNASTSTVSVSNMSVNLTGCGTDEFFTVYCGALAGVASPGAACPPGDSTQELPAGLRPLWDFGYTLSSGPRESGFRSVSVPGPAVYRVCLYTKGYDQGGAFGGTSLLASADTQALPPPPATLTRGKATQAAKQALSVKFGRKYSKGKKKKIDCAKSGSGFNCDVSWKYKKKKYKGTVKVTGSRSNPRTTVNVNAR